MTSHRKPLEKRLHPHRQRTPRQPGIPIQPSRAAFKADKEIVGLKPGQSAVHEARGPRATEYSEEEAARISAAITAKSTLPARPRAG